MSKMIDSEKLATLAKALDNRSKNLVKKAKEELNAAIDLLELGKVDYEDLEEYQKQSDDLLATDNKTIVGAINEVVDSMSSLNAITLNGYSLWVGSSTELNALPERDEKTLYFEIDDDEIEEVVQVDIVDNKLNLTADKYQKANVVNGTEIIFPDVNKFTEIHLYFDANENMSLVFPDNCKYRVDPNIEEGNSYEIVATYNTMKWLVNVIVYS